MAAWSHLEHGVPEVALHVVGGLVEVADARDVVLAALADDVSVVGDEDGGVPEHVAVRLVPLQDRRDDHHVVLHRQLPAHAAAVSHQVSLAGDDIGDDENYGTTFRELGGKGDVKIIGFRKKLSAI